MTGTADTGSRLERLLPAGHVDRLDRRPSDRQAEEEAGVLPRPQAR